LQIDIYTDEISDKAFNLLYDIKLKTVDGEKAIAHAKTGMVCYNYQERKIAMLTKELKNHLAGVGN